MLAGIFISTGLLHSQNKKTEFKYLNQQENSVVFAIVGKTGSETTKKLLELAQSSDQIISFKVFYDHRCKVVFVDNDMISADKIRKKLLELGVDYDIDYVKTLDKATNVELSQKKSEYHANYIPRPIPSNQWVYPSDFPMEEEFNDLVLFKKAKQDWIEDHPEEYRQMTGMEYLDYSLKLNGKN